MLNQKVRKKLFLHFLELTTTLHSIVKSVLEEFKLNTANYNYRGREEDTILKPTAHTTVSRSACIGYFFININIHCTIYTHTKNGEKGRSTCLCLTWPCWASCNWIFWLAAESSGNTSDFLAASDWLASWLAYQLYWLHFCDFPQS